MKTKLFVIPVIRPPEPAESAEFHAVLEDGQERYEKCFVSLRERAKQMDIELETDVVLGHPAEQIIHKADRIQASLIVMGKRSHTILHRWMLGSNSEEGRRVREFASCMYRTDVADWLRGAPVFCIPHRTKLRCQAQPEVTARVDAIIENCRRQLTRELQSLRDKPEAERPGSGSLGRAAEFLVSQRGLHS